MEHTEAVRLQAAEKYLLGELSEAQREEYEEHYFDCPTCAEELKVTVAFMETVKQVSRETLPVPAPAKDEKQRVDKADRSRGFFAWLRPAFAIPAFAALLLLAIVLYQNTLTIPSLKQGSAQNLSAHVVSSFSLMGVAVRGGSGHLIRVGQDEPFDLEVDFPPVSSAGGYVGQIQDASGQIKFSVPVSLTQAKDTVHVSIPAGLLHPGKFDFVILAVHESAAQTGELKEISRLPFTIEFQP